ncbi:hypothetical protein B0H15DRAFT_791789 [Mycena belliarum]|uniref:CxC2-like cysteine cluster KDZ transposase-associated domain-containing protein n=1 Tax=Mycena belliarum TaxID=1033014 RepID=A0AAD6XJI1_9AGAR|nr:hypothetical protein B0H15DRAFT_791789 [Mycena belliae]
MSVWAREFRDETLDEMLRGEGRGAPEFYAKCGACKKPDPLFRCARQTCIGPAMYCEDCIVSMHRQLPTHMVEMWSGEFYIPMPMNELQVEARMQLGHAPGTYCPKATSAHRDFVIMDTLGIYTVKLNFCGCDTRITHRQQLMRACLWPATSLDPQTCATFNAIRLFEVQNCHPVFQVVSLLATHSGIVITSLSSSLHALTTSQISEAALFLARSELQARQDVVESRVNVEGRDRAQVTSRLDQAPSVSAYAQIAINSGA